MGGTTHVRSFVWGHTSPLDNLFGSATHVGSFSWVELKRTPVGLHPNCKKHLKKSTKVDAEYNWPTWVPKTRVNMTKRRIPGVDLRVHHVLPRVPHNAPIIIISWSCTRNRHEVRLCVCIFIGDAYPQKYFQCRNQRTFSEQSVHIQGRNSQCTFREQSVHIQGTFSEHSVNIQ